MTQAVDRDVAVQLDGGDGGDAQPRARRLRLTREHALLLVFAAIAVVVGIVAYLDNPTKFVALFAAGLAEGAIVTLAALGFLLIQKATGIANFAQGDLITLGAYLASWAVLDLGFDLVPAYVFAIAIMFVVGAVIERVAYAPLRGRPIHVVVIATLGVAIILRSILGIWLGSSPRFLESPLTGKVVEIGDAVVSQQRILIMIATAVVVVLTILMFQRTSIGRQLRAVAADRDTARLCGVRANVLSMLAFAVSAAMAGLAGVLIGPLGSFDLTLGFKFMLLGFAAAVIGGFGSIIGVVVGGIVIGLTEQLLGGYMLLDYQSTLPFVIMLLVIAVRPQGLFSSDEGHRL